MLTYFYGYKDNSFIGVLSYIFFFSAWITIAISLFGKFYSFNKSKYSLNRKLWLNQTLINGGIIVFAVCGIFLSIIFTGKLTDKRIENILYTETTHETIAEVKNLESRYTRGGWKIWAIFEYKNLENKTYQKGIFNYNSKFKKGDKYYIFYSEKYPEIIELEDKLE